MYICLEAWYNVYIMEKQMKIYVDMDGVIADFFAQLSNHFQAGHWKEIPEPEKSIKLLVGTDFFYKIPKFETSDELVKFIHEITNGDWNILSSPLRGDHENSKYWKNKWLEKHEYRPKESIFVGRKEKYAVNKDGTPNILIDDRHENIEKWKAKGGIGIRYQANEHPLDILKKQILSNWK